MRYFRLLDALDELVRQPPWTPVALGSAEDVLRPRVRAEWKRLRRLVRAAQEAEPGHDRDEHLHEVRKAAKRLRYAAEAVEPAFGAKAARLAAAAESVQEVLGDLNDSVVTRALLRQLAAESAGRPGNALLYGRMHAAEERHAARARGAVRRRLARLLQAAAAALAACLRGPAAPGPPPGRARPAVPLDLCWAAGGAGCLLPHRVWRVHRP